MNAQNFGELVMPLEQVETPTQDLDDAGEALVQEAPLGQTIIYNQAGIGETLAPELATLPNPTAELPLFSSAETERFHLHWTELQSQFVDEPRATVNLAGALVGEVIEKISVLFAAEHDTLEKQWKDNPNASTEDLRLALQHYHAFFNRLLRQVTV